MCVALFCVIKKLIIKIFMIKRIKGDPNIDMFQKKASTAMTAGSAVCYDAGSVPSTVRLLTATDPAVLGVILQTIAATDADYTSTTRVAVDKLDVGAVIEADVDTTTTSLAATDEGKYFKIYTGGLKIDGNTASATRGAGFTAQGLVFLCTKFISTSKGEFVIVSHETIRPSST